MSLARALALLLLLPSASAFAQNPPSPRDVPLTAADGTRLQATYYPSAKRGPPVLLLHMCNTTRKSWDPGVEAAAGPPTGSRTDERSSPGPN